MPAILRRVDASQLHYAASLVQRDTYRGRNRQSLSPTAIAFIVPLFAAFILGPFLCVWLTRNRRSRRMPRPVEPRTIVERREDAREKLGMVTEVSKVTAEGKYAYNLEVHEDKSSTDSMSMQERDCAICLSSLHAPSPPEPAKLADEGVTDVTPPSVSGTPTSEEEEILKLKVCGHEFHAECLISWFVLRKYSCPICRAVFYEKEPKPKVSEEHELREIESNESQPTRSAAGNGPTRAAE